MSDSSSWRWIGHAQVGESPLLDGTQPAKRIKTEGGPKAHLAGQNPMLASMLAQTPRPVANVPTSIANAIVSQIPQDRLPKNLEKKLLPTPAPPPTSQSGNGQNGGQGVSQGLGASTSPTTSTSSTVNPHAHISMTLGSHGKCRMLSYVSRGTGPSLCIHYITYMHSTSNRIYFCKSR